jgi:S1-C subfamily serine protease
MFADAIGRAAEYTCPYVAMRRKHDGEVFSSIGAFIILNREGWVLTAAHLVAEIGAARASVEGGRQIQARLDELGALTGAQAKGRKHDEKKLRSELAEHLAQGVEIWAVPGFSELKPRIAEQHVVKEADLAVARLEPFDADQVAAYPLLRSDDDPVRPGMPVARVGYPFHTVEAEYDDERSSFDVTAGFPVPSFASDGIVSRFRGLRAEDGREYLYIETSTPGLRGQSGGPLVDVEGRLCGVQSRTIHYDLGFDAHVERNGRKETERQFLNVGEASHVQTVRNVLNTLGVECAGL